MAFVAHHAASQVITGKFQQILHVLTGKAVVIRKGQPASQTTTDYLLSHDANKLRLLDGISELERGEGKLKQLR